MKNGLLLSGGMDSVALAWWKKPDMAFTLNYGQLAAQAEIDASKIICQQLQIPHQVIEIDCRQLGSGDMAGCKPDHLAPASDWWPYRNQMLVTLAAMKAISFGITHLWLGTVKSDGIHIDGTPEFMSAISHLLSIQEGGIVVEAPAIELTTSELVRKSGTPANLLAWAHSCHKSHIACGHCRGCNKYMEVFHEVGYDLDRLG
ncbi:7-cyano-7-deazaguanine synthase [Enterobacter cloacae]|uniref:7-cyano-7-deazaguanine synthase n=1 Tax=Enterobacter cloacae TaxID=550 RepID=UPI0007356A2A|nr:7-cyano-7-deazaguanine synthase [Enterobacter cloacae]KTH76261.1 7-cyano-7-deazaguanine synthase [Enterobacter cloacae subsp. cloacae]MDE7636703.1 7-cyano-7-deazaguanine synthase [Enterobacter cloacae]MDR9914741.1 7-cyano-7-deazaguanine synthase [Enterobacter cloacae subsp. cloacae]HAS1234701.1 7-cyano-7-deazaguanine synthase [Enterobacter cloacae]HAS1239423.1 7-cyano-7-deazaguanine synthase [Enterobacter cloacae]